MTQSDSFFDPFGFFRGSFSWPVNQRITTPWFSPTVNVTYAGDRVIEDRVTSDVASYGRQLGWLSELVIALARDEPVPKQSLKQLQDAAEKIEAIKRQRQKSLRDSAVEALDRLKRDRPAEYKNLVHDRAAETD